MNFEEFKQQLMEDLKEALSRRVGTEVAVEENEVHKLQQESYDGIVVRKENESIGVNVDATRLYSDLEQGRAYEDVLHYAVDIAQKGFEDAPMIDISQIMNYEVMKHSLITQLIPVAGNEDMLANIPHKQIEDLALVYRISVGRDEHGQSTILVKNDMLDRYGITAEQLHDDAMMSAPQIEAPSMKTLFETTAEIMGEDFIELMGEVEPAMPGVYVCTNESKHHGAHFPEDARNVIRCWHSTDVAACPGSGKTTVLLAKLKLLADRMPLENGAGVCVLSHTNVAVDEIRNRLSEYADKLLGYPNYIGTIQSFVDKFVTIGNNRDVSIPIVCHHDWLKVGCCVDISENKDIVYFLA